LLSIVREGRRERERERKKKKKKEKGLNILIPYFIKVLKYILII
jgi:hypothetical protein